MTGRVQTARSNVSGNRPTGRQPGELYVNWADSQIGVVNSTGSNQDFVAVRFFSTAANYVIGDFVVQSGQLYRAIAASSAGAFVPANWQLSGGSVSVGDTPPAVPQAGGLWFDSVGGQLYVWYADPNTSQWVPATNQVGGGYATIAYVDAKPVAMNDNRIINGDMRIDQRGVASSGSSQSINVYTIDRWLYSASVASKLSWTRSASNQPGFPYQFQFSSASAYAVVAGDYFALQQVIEADMVSDFAWGTANAQAVTLSFWVVSSLTGTFGGAVQNDASNRSYPFTYSIPAANTWTKIVVTIPGDTAGTWVMGGNNAAITLSFSLGMGSTRSGPANAWATANYVSATGAKSVVATNAAIFGVTGVKLEIGSVVTPYNRQSLAKSLADCQRYYRRLGGTSSGVRIDGYAGAAGVTMSATLPFPDMRAAPTATLAGTWGGTNTGAPSILGGSSGTVVLATTTNGAGGMNLTTTGPTTYIDLAAEL